MDVFVFVFAFVFVFVDDRRRPSVVGGQQSVEERGCPDPPLLVIHFMMRIRMKIDMQLMNIIQIFGWNFCSLLSTVLTIIITIKSWSPYHNDYNDFKFLMMTQCCGWWSSTDQSSTADISHNRHNRRWRTFLSWRTFFLRERERDCF